MSNAHKFKLLLEARDIVERELSLVDYIDHWPTRNATKSALDRRLTALVAQIEGMQTAPTFLLPYDDPLPVAEDLFGPFP